MQVIDYTTAYFDESRVDDGSPFPVVAGFCGTYDVWEAFEKKWREASKHIPDGDIKKYFRHRPSANNSSEDEKRYKDSLVLAEIMRRYTLFSISVSIEKAFFQSAFDAANKRKTPLTSSAYTVCAHGCCVALDTMAATKLLKRWTPIKVVFDKGNAGERWLEHGYNEYYSRKPDTRLKKTVSFEDDEDLIPLRAADAYAWLLGRKYNQGEELEQLKIIHHPQWASERLNVVITAERAAEILTEMASTKSP